MVNDAQAAFIKPGDEYIETGDDFPALLVVTSVEGGMTVSGSDSDTQFFLTKEGAVALAALLVKKAGELP